MSTYKTLIRPIIEYAPFIPSIVSNSNRERLETIQRKAARIALGWSSRSSVKNLNNKFNSFKLEPIINRTAKLTKNYLMKASKANELIRCQIIESKQIIDPAKCPKRMTILSSITYGPDKWKSTTNNRINSNKGVKETVSQAFHQGKKKKILWKPIISVSQQLQSIQSFSLFKT